MTSGHLAVAAVPAEGCPRGTVLRLFVTRRLRHGYDVRTASGAVKLPAPSTPSRLYSTTAMLFLVTSRLSAPPPPLRFSVRRLHYLGGT